MDADVVVVGAGAVGLACAAELARSGRSVVLVERHGTAGQETSSRNSQVVHAGIYYPSGSLKAELCVRGNRSLSAWCEAHDVPFRRIGKYLLAVEAEEERRLAEVAAQGRSNGALLLEVPLAQLRAEEPRVRAAAAVWSPTTGILDVHGLFRSLAVAAEAHGASFAYRHVLRAAQRAGDGYDLAFAGPDGEEVTLSASRVVNAAGLDSDTVAALPGLDVAAAGYRLHWARGHYFRIRPGKRGVARHLLYPVHPEGAAGLGVHVTVDLDGELKLGPDLEWLSERRQDYAVREELSVDFLRAARRFLPYLEEGDLSPDQSGIRPRLAGPGEPFRDFVVAEESARGLPGWVNLVGIESPGLTCCLELAERVRELLYP